MIARPWSDSQPIRRVLMTCDAVGGVWTYVMELARGLAAHQIELLLALMGPAPSQEQKVEIESLENVELVHREFDLEWTDSPWTDVDRAGAWLLRLAAEFEPDVVHLNGYAPATLRWQSPVLIVAHSCVLTWWSAVKGEAAPPRYDEYARRVRAALKPSFVVTPTNAFRDQLVAEYGFNPRGITISNARSSKSTAWTADSKQQFIFSA